jgi:hypothetical protein
MNIKVIGLTGARTQQAIINAQAALREFKPYAEVEWIDDVRKINELRIARLPAVLINDRLKVDGRIPSIHEITSLIGKELTQKSVA